MTFDSILECFSLSPATHPRLRSRNPEAAARIFMGTLMSYVITQKILHGQAILPTNREEVIDALVDMVVHYSTRGDRSV